MKVLVIRAEHGKVTESLVVDGDLYGVAKEYAGKALEEWDPVNSDFIVLRDVREIRLKLPLDPQLFDTLRNLGVPLRKEGGEAVAEVPFILISFDNVMLGENEYQENKIYVISLYLGDEVKLMFEADAADLTSPRTGPPGIVEEA